MLESPAIIVLTYNRPKSLRRLLNSLSNARYNEQNVVLVISIDYQVSKSHNEVQEIAKSFEWKHGEKVVLCREENLGLRKHVLSCGELTSRYGSVIMLEDDIVVSPNFYLYTQKVIDSYKDDTRIGGFSLYNHKKNFCNKLSFELLGESDSDVFFLQIASSWGQAWTASQWKEFYEWYNCGQELFERDLLPIEIVNWPATSWLKYFIKYLVDTNKYFVYPKISYSTNFGDGGTHNLTSNSSYQVPLDYASNFELRLKSLDESINVYDSFFELEPVVLKKLYPKFANTRILVDTYGAKDLSKYDSEFVLSPKRIPEKKIVSSFGINLKPACLNVVMENVGNELFIGKRIDFDNSRVDEYLYINKWDYFSSVYSTKVLLKRLLHQLKKKIR